MILRVTLLLTLGLTFSAPEWAEVPEECIQAPQRQAYCPHTLYRVARVAVPSLAINEGGMVCLCLSDLTDLPVARQQSAFTEIAREYALPPLALYQLLRIPAPEWTESK